MANATSTSTTLVEGGIDGLGEPQVRNSRLEYYFAY